MRAGMVRTRGWAGLVWTLAALGAGCLYRQEPAVEDLFPGDVTGVVHGTAPGQSSSGPLGGARVQLRRASTTRMTASNGRFVLRSLPEGTHALIITYDPNNDLVPDLARQVAARIRIPQGRSQRPHVDLGEITLLRPGRINGHVSGTLPADLSQVTVAVLGAEIRVPVNVDGTFTVTGLGPSLEDVPDTAWSVVAAAPGALSNVVTVMVEENGTHQVELVLAGLPPNAPDVTVTLDVDLAPAPEGTPSVITAPLVSPPGAYAFAADGTLVDERTRTGTSHLLQVPPGLYDFLIDEGDEFIPVYAGLLVVPAEGLQYSAVALRRSVERCAGTNSEDMDGDGRCAMPSGAEQLCIDACLLGSTCGVDGVDYDCDDDADGQNDADERLNCRCAPAADPQVDCSADPSRQDVNHNGVCDRAEFRTAADTGSSASSSSSGSSGSSSSGGSSSSSGAASSTGGSSSSSSSTSSSTSSGGGGSSGLVVECMSASAGAALPENRPTGNNGSASLTAVLDEAFAGDTSAAVFFVSNNNTQLFTCPLSANNCDLSARALAVPLDSQGALTITGLTVATGLNPQLPTEPSVVISSADGIRHCLLSTGCTQTGQWNLVNVAGGISDVRVHGGKFYWLQDGAVFSCSTTSTCTPTPALPGAGNVAHIELTSAGIFFNLATDTTVRMANTDGTTIPVDYGCQRPGVLQNFAVSDTAPARLWLLESSRLDYSRIAYCDRDEQQAGFVCASWTIAAEDLPVPRGLSVLASPMGAHGVSWAEGPEVAGTRPAAVSLVRLP